MVIRTFSEYQRLLEVSNDLPLISDLQPDELPMVSGIAEILRQVKDVENRREIADDQIRQFKQQGIRFDYSEFIKLCEL